MRVLYLGIIGDDVAAWQSFLRGTNKNSKIFVNSVFDEFTKLETQQFQRTNKMTADGVVGNQTYAVAMKLGFNVLQDDREDESSASWPKKPVGTRQLTDDERYALFGKFSYIPAPTAQNPEGIKITDGWPRANIVQVNIPQLRNVKNAPSSCNISFHKKGAEQLKTTFVEIEKRGLLDRVLTFNGTWVPRFIRGSTTKLSNHSLGTAIDINVPWNKLGTQGALKGQEGSVRELVEVFYEHGLFWGGWFDRIDAMHFEIYKIL